MAPPILWAGRLSLPMTLLMNANNLVAAATGQARDVRGMKDRVRRGYEAEFTDDVRHYDDVALRLQDRAARLQLRDVDVAGKNVLDVGSGTGVLSFVALEAGARFVTAGDISALMLGAAERKAQALGYGPDRMTFVVLDAEALPFPDATFDVAMTGMMLGLLPDPDKAVAELARVTRPGGLVCVGAHGPEHYWEGIDASLRSLQKRYALGHRMEFWPRSERQVEAMLGRAGLTDVMTIRAIWRNGFASAGDAYDFFAAVTSAFWYSLVPAGKRPGQAERTRRWFERARVTRITDDVVFAYGRRPH